MNTEFHQIDLPGLTHITDKLSQYGKIKVSSRELTYLKIDDNYIHQLFPLLNDFLVVKPNYFGPYNNHMGAHISIFYPNENVKLKSDDLEREHKFSIKGFFSAMLFDKRYYALTVNAPSLIDLRQQYHLGPQPSFRGQLVELHITVAIQSI